MFKEYIQADSKEAPRFSADGDDNLKQIQFKLGEIINSIIKFEALKPEKVTKAQYETFLSTNNEMINSVEEIMRKELGSMQEEKQIAILRFQKVLSQQKKKIKALTTRSWRFIEEEKKKSDDLESETSQLLENDVDIQKLENFEEFVHDRNKRITKVLKDMHVVNKIYKDMALMTQEQSEHVEIIHGNIEKTEDTMKKTNKQLLKYKYKGHLSYSRYFRILIVLVIALIFTFFLIRHWSYEAIANLPVK